MFWPRPFEFRQPEQVIHERDHDTQKGQYHPRCDTVDQVDILWFGWHAIEVEYPSLEAVAVAQPRVPLLIQAARCPEPSVAVHALEHQKQVLVVQSLDQRDGAHCVKPDLRRNVHQNADEKAHHEHVAVGDVDSVVPRALQQ
jgi:hypothetical protein